MDCLGSPLRRAHGIFLLVCLSSAFALATTQNSHNLNFGSVQVGSTSTKPIAVTNTQKTNMTLSQVNITGSSFGFAGPTLPITLAPQQTVQLSISFTPQTSGSLSGTGTVSCVWGNGKAPHNSNVSTNFSGTGVAPGYLSVPSSMNLGTVMVGSSQTQPLTLSNTGASSLTISSATVNGSGFTISGLSFPYTLAAGASVNLSVTFSPTIVGAVNATLSLISNASNPSVSVSLTGTGSSPNGTLGVTPGSINFGTVTIGNTQSQSGSLTASGGNVVVSSASSNNSLFTLAGLSLPITIQSGQSVPFSVTFAPTAVGAASANISFFTSNSTSVETASGSGGTIQHIVDLSWNPSTSDSVTGYNVYRATAVTGPFSRINSSLDSSLSYSDNVVTSGQTYYYTTTAVDSEGVESSYSNQVQVSIPFP